MRRRLQQGTAGVSVGRLFVWTAVIAVVLTIGLITGQRMVVERSLSPVVSAGEPPRSFVEPEPELDSSDAMSRSDLFSFYDALTSAEVKQIMRAADETEVQRRDLLVEDEELGDDEVAMPEQSNRGAEELSAQDGTVETGEGFEQTDDGTEAARFTLQIAAHPSLERARTEMDRLRAHGLEPHVIAATVPGRGKFYRVRVGKFATESQARAFQAEIRDEHGVQSFPTPL